MEEPQAVCAPDKNYSHRMHSSRTTAVNYSLQIAETGTVRPGSLAVNNPLGNMIRKVEP